MAYADAWNESAPAGSVAANTLDTIIQQQVKRALRERLAQCIAAFADDAQDPKRIKIYTNDEFTSGLTPEEGELWYDTVEDVLKLFFNNEWLNIGAVALWDIFSNRPSAEDVREGTLFWDSDGERLYIVSEGEWVSVIPEEEFLVYKETQTYSVNTLTTQSYTCAVADVEADPATTILQQVRGRFRVGSNDWGPWVLGSVSGTSIGSDIEFEALHVFANYQPPDPDYQWLVNFTIQNVNGGSQTITGEVEITLRKIGEGIIEAT